MKPPPKLTFDRKGNIKVPRGYRLLTDQDTHLHPGDLFCTTRRWVLTRFAGSTRASLDEATYIRRKKPLPKKKRK